MAKCGTCANAIFDALWGEYKCSVRERVIFAHEVYKDCEYYKPGEPKESKRNKSYEEAIGEED